MLEYFALAISVWFAGFFPFLEIYAAIPYGFVIGLDPYSVVFWAVLGNFMPVPLIEYGYGWLEKSERFRRWQQKLIKPSLEEKINRKGKWFIAVFTPWIGVWAVAVSCKVMKVKREVLLVYTFIGIAAYAVAMALLIALGISVVS